MRRSGGEVLGAIENAAAKWIPGSAQWLAPSHPRPATPLDAAVRWTLGGPYKGPWVDLHSQASHYISTGLTLLDFWCAPDTCKKKIWKNRFLTKSGKFVRKACAEMRAVEWLGRFQKSISTQGGRDIPYFRERKRIFLKVIFFLYFSLYFNILNY